jgi:beta-N-acetylhexosaminidase
MSDLPLGQLFCVGFEGHEVSAETAAHFKELGLGGAILFSRNILPEGEGDAVEQVVRLNGQLTDLGTDEHPMLISVDQEGGRVARLRHVCTRVPTMRALGDASHDDADLPYRVGAMMARELGALGFHMDYAPDVDVDTNPDNPVIGDRSFGRDPELCAAVAVQFIRGMQQAGVAASAKHFPGHGDTASDSHFELPRLPHDLARLEKVELVPFRAAIDVGVASVMTAHILFEALDGERPATLSPDVINGLLRDKLGYDGVVISDDLEMAAVADAYEIEELVRLGLLAGVDQFLICHSAEKQARAVETAHKLVDGGEVPREVAEAALRRIAAMKARFVGAPARPDLASARDVVRARPHLELMERFDLELGPDRASPVDHA